ncbi:amino acid ABC transporter permease [Clostridium cylindrosporum]|uniref:Amine acid ABC transporter, permease protein, 3-TM region, His/Glu/Gln/Arg/opine family n=1 Tax=Clostridium cylindrosporum DSM 605 TaxID=1121307 RepID=A0A0J8DAQ5_CLOCY|nr:amino acid ABC transporter permease [Clostridium cylindrosporum]KMT23125.1 amine acid ABC transporter, permease protein, 3-TM region, His/Glu/Gln/Arg/opine family [Clostridium cylindrosporum DSM 605]
MSLDFSFLSEYYPLYISGTKNTILLAIFSVLIGAIIGTGLALMKLSKSKILKSISVAYIEFIRGTPLLIQLSIFYYAILPALGVNSRGDTIFGGDVIGFMACIIAISLNSAAYVAEIIRAGIESIDNGQMEAARSLGMNKVQAMRYIILPQAIKNILPALGNEFIVVIKESSIVSVIGIQEIMYNAQTITSATFSPFPPLIVAAIIYFVLTFTLSKALGVLERRLK